MARFGWLFSRKRDSLDAPTANSGCLEADLQPDELRVNSEPCTRRCPYAARLRRIDHLQGVPEAGTALFLDFDHQDAVPSAQDQVELVAAGAGVGLEQAVAAEAVVAECAALAAIHAAS
jgi:hypothetical protein